MACCIVAMLIMAHVMAALRRWGVFWGVVRPAEGEASDTVFQRMHGWLALPRVRLVVLAVVAVEAAAVGSWLTVAHGTHIRQLSDQAIGAMRGQTIVYADVCGRDGAVRTVRVVIGEPDPFGHRTVETMI